MTPTNCPNCGDRFDPDLDPESLPYCPSCALEEAMTGRELDAILDAPPPPCDVTVVYLPDGNRHRWALADNTTRQQVVIDVPTATAILRAMTHDLIVARITQPEP